MFTKPSMDLGLRGFELFKAVRNQIDAEPERWAQGSWGKLLGFDGFIDEDGLLRFVKQQAECETAFCVAGWACVLSGESVVFPKGYGSAIMVKNGHQISRTAMDLLGLQEEDISELFHGGNTLENIDEIASRIWDAEGNYVGIQEEDDD